MSELKSLSHRAGFPWSMSSLSVEPEAPDDDVHEASTQGIQFPGKGPVEEPTRVSPSTEQKTETSMSATVDQSVDLTVEPEPNTTQTEFTQEDFNDILFDMTEGVEESANDDGNLCAEVNDHGDHSNDVPATPDASDTLKTESQLDIQNGISSFDPNTKLQCFNCSNIFKGETFAQHICDYDSDHNYITDASETHDSEAAATPCAAIDPVPSITQLPSAQQDELSYKEKSALHILETNNAALQTWLKYDYKLDLAKKNPSTASAADLPSKKADGPHCCKKCDRKFVHASGLSRHMEKHDNDKSSGSAWSLAMNHDPGAPVSLEMATKCMQCLCVFRRVHDCLEHMRIDHEMAGDRNETVDFSDDEVELFKEDHFHDSPQVVLVSSILRCEFCEFIFSTVDALLDHSSAHDPRHGYECVGCEIRTPSIRDISKHWFVDCPFVRYDSDRRSLVQTYFVCNVCENKFTTPAKLYDHRRSSFHLYPRLSGDQNEILIACEECGKVFDTAAAVVVHQQEAHQTKVRASAKRNALDTASKMAKVTVSEPGFSESSKYRQYLCDVCGKSYTQSSHLWQHLRFHKGVKPFACKEPNCTRRFTIRPDLNDHIRKCHTGERPYHCQICDKRFLTGSVFYQHRLIHRGERRYGCDDCGKRFYRADALKNHQRIHTGEKPYACTQCQKTFRQRGDRDKHIRARHSGVLGAKETIGMATTAGRLSMAGAMGRGRIRCKKDLLLQRPPVPRMQFPFGMRSSGGVPVRQCSDPESGDVVYVGSMAFPTSMFKPVVSDIDAGSNNMY